MRGQTARRTARHFGYSYEYESGRAAPGEPLPEWLAELRARAAHEPGVGVEPEELVEALVQRYPAGASIGWHRDAPAFGSVVGISLGSPCRMRFRRKDERFDLTLAPRSLYVLAGASRWSWQHSIPPAAELRYSITFRTLRGGGG